MRNVGPRRPWLPFLLLFAAGCAGAGNDTADSRALLGVPAMREWRSADGEPRISQPGARLYFDPSTDTVPGERVSARAERVEPFGNVLLLAIERERRDWRREAYRQRGPGLEWCGMAEAGKPWVAFDPPIPLVALPARTGSSKAWQGIVRTGRQRLKASANSRLEDPERLVLSSGRSVEAWPIRSTVTISDDGIDPISIQEVRWLVPGLGVVRRSRLEDGRMIHFQLGKSEVRVGER